MDGSHLLTPDMAAVMDGHTQLCGTNKLMQLVWLLCDCLQTCSVAIFCLRQCCKLCRWRKLEGSDPSAYEMIQKVQTLQKRLISKTEEVVEADLLIQEKEKLYVELKNILARQPGPEVAEQLSIYQVCPQNVSVYDKCNLHIMFDRLTDISRMPDDLLVVALV